MPLLCTEIKAMDGLNQATFSCRMFVEIPSCLFMGSHERVGRAWQLSNFIYPHGFNFIFLLFLNVLLLQV